MGISQEPGESERLYRGNNGCAGESVLYLPLTSPYSGTTCDGEFHQPKNKEMGCICQSSNLQHSIFLMQVKKDLGQFRSKRSKLRDPGFEAAVDRIIKGIETILPGLSESQSISTVP